MLGDIDKKILSAEDVLQNFILFNLASSFKELGEELYFYRKNPKSISASSKITQIQTNIKSHDEAIAIIQNLAQKNLLNQKITRLFIYLLRRARYHISLDLLSAQDKFRTRHKLEKYLYKKRYKFKRMLYRLFGVI